MTTYATKTRILGYLLFAVGLLPFYLLPVWAGVLYEFYAFEPWQVGMLLAADTGGGTIASLAARFWITRANWRRAVLSSLSCAVLVNSLSIFSDSFTALFLLRILAGIAAGCFMAVVYAMFSSSENPDREFSIALALQVLLGAAAIYSMPIFLKHFGPGSLFAVVAMVTVAPMLVAANCPPGGDSDTAKSPSLRNISHYVWAGLAAIALVFLSLSCIWVAMERLGSAAGFDGSVVTTVLAASMLFSFLGAAAPAITTNLTTRKVQLSVSYVSLAIAIFTVGNNSTVLLFALGVCLYNFFYSFIIPIQTAWLAQSDLSGATAVLVPVAQGLGVTVGPIVGGYLVGDGNFTGVIVASSAFLALSYICAKCAGDPIRSV